MKQSDTNIRSSARMLFRSAAIISVLYFLLFLNRPQSGAVESSANYWLDDWTQLDWYGHILMNKSRFAHISLQERV